MDKLIQSGDEAEIPVSLCNYLDVYRNRRLSKPYEFSQGSDCTQTAEADRFTIKKGDVLITKDSETPNDIGVPCLIADEFENTVCGYHLTRRPSPEKVPNHSTRLLYRHLFNNPEVHPQVLPGRPKRPVLQGTALNRARTIKGMPIPQPLSRTQSRSDCDRRRVLDATVEYAMSNSLAAVIARPWSGLQRGVDAATAHRTPQTRRHSALSKKEFWAHSKAGQLCSQRAGKSRSLETTRGNSSEASSLIVLAMNLVSMEARTHSFRPQTLSRAAGYISPARSDVERGRPTHQPACSQREQS